MSISNQANFCSIAIPPCGFECEFAICESTLGQPNVDCEISNFFPANDHNEQLGFVKYLWNCVRRCGRSAWFESYVVGHTFKPINSINCEIDLKLNTHDTQISLILAIVLSLRHFIELREKWAGRKRNTFVHKNRYYTYSVVVGVKCCLWNRIVFVYSIERQYRCHWKHDTRDILY